MAVGLFLALLPAAGSPKENQGTATARPRSSQAHSITFSRDIAPIVFNHCAVCHHPGQVAPFPLLSYEDVGKRARLIAMVTEKRYMPPWKPAPGYGEFEGARRLTDGQINTIQQWAEEGAPQGDPSDLPPVPHFSGGWYLGKPDLTLTMKKPFEVPADGPDVYHCFTLPVNLSEDKYYVAFDLHPSDPKVVHHALVVQAVHGASSQLEKIAGDGYPCFGGFGILTNGSVGFWTPGAFPVEEPPGVAKVLKKNSDLILQLHLHPSGKTEQEQSTIGFYFAKEPPSRVPVDLTLGSVDIDIPPGDKDYKVTDTSILPVDVEVLSIIPHAHLLCRQIKAWATLPDGSRKPLIWIEDWDFNWQQQYRYKNPVALPMGTRIDAEWIYDNSTSNPRNPNAPPKRVTWGEQSTDEMAELHIEVLTKSPADSLRLLTSEWLEKGDGMQARARRLLPPEPWLRRSNLGIVAP
jgi:hypothetical protein